MGQKQLINYCRPINLIGGKERLFSSTAKVRRILRQLGGMKFNPSPLRDPHPRALRVSRYWSLDVKSSYWRLSTVRSLIISEAKRDKLHKKNGVGL